MGNYLLIFNIAFFNGTLMRFNIKSTEDPEKKLNFMTPLDCFFKYFH